MEATKQQEIATIANVIRNQVDEKQWINIGLGAEEAVDSSRLIFVAAVRKLKTEGYPTFNLRIKKPEGYRIVRVLGLPGSTVAQCYESRQNIAKLTPRKERTNG